MASTHELSRDGDRIRKRYRSWDRGEHIREWTVLGLLHSHTDDRVPVPVSADLSGDPPTITMSVLRGGPLGGCLTDAQLDALELALRDMWSAPLDGAPQRRFGPVEAVAAAKELYASVPGRDGVVGRALEVARAFVRTVDLPEFSQQILGHSDPNLANYLWDGSRVRIVDFEDAGRSDVAYELATLVEHLSAHGTEWEAFCSRFEVDRGRLQDARRLAASLWLYMLLPGQPAAKRNSPETLELQAERLLELM